MLQHDISILYAEDDPTTQKLLCPILEGQGYRVYFAENGLKGLELFRAHSPDIVLTDIKMPYMDGLEMAGIIREEAPAAQIIMLTSYSDTEYMMRAIDIGINQFLLKPIQFKKLKDVIKRCANTIRFQRCVQEQAEHIRMLSNALEQTPSIVMITDTQGVIEYVNRKFVEVSGFTAEEAIGKTPRIIRSDETAASVYENLWSTILAGRVWKDVLKNRGKNNNVFWVHSSISPLTTPDGRITKFICSAEDITEQRRLETETLKIEKLEANAILAGGMAHDFNNLLQIILGYISLAKQKTAPDSKANELLNLAEKISWRASQLSKQLLIFAKGGDVALQPTSLRELLTASIESALNSTNITMQLDLQDDIPPLNIDPTQMKQVFSHIAINAQEAMPAGGTLRIAACTCDISPADGLALEPGRYAHISFSDNGKGIAQEYLERIFDPYFTTKERWNQKGLGMGLAICNSVIRKHNGVITVDSAPGQGTAFHVYLPAPENN